MSLSKRLYIILFAALTLAGSSASAKDKKSISFEYEAQLEMRFDNREFDRAQNYFTRSMTMFGTSLVGDVGVGFKSPLGGKHRLMVGVDVLKNFGSVSPSPVFRGVNMYYQLQKKIGEKCDMELYAGRFPRNVQEGGYTEAFLSDSIRFERNALEGLLVKFRRPKSYYEIGVDWMGRPEGESRERFMIYGSADASLAPWVSVGGNGYIYHYAGSDLVEGVVDNILIEPWAKFDLAPFTPLQELSFRLSWLQGGQQDRVKVHKYVFPGGPTLDFKLMKWNVYVRNFAYFGRDLMPYYNVVDAGGFKYGSTLYYGDPFFRTRAASPQDRALFDRLTIGWEPCVTSWLSIAVRVHMNFTDRYEGMSQFVSVKFNIDSLNPVFKTGK
ncbi:MAG: hypothetical protein MJY62_04190 [Bacteroidales bacterium]|nr:hypothetical protein [Bacteroidales bacterium]